MPRANKFFVRCEQLGTDPNYGPVVELGTIYDAYPYMPGETSEQLLERRKKFPIGTVLSFICTLVESDIWTWEFFSQNEMRYKLALPFLSSVSLDKFKTQKMAWRNEPRKNENTFINHVRIKPKFKPYHDADIIIDLDSPPPQAPPQTQMIQEVSNPEQWQKTSQETLEETLSRLGLI